MNFMKRSPKADRVGKMHLEEHVGFVFVLLRWF